MKVSAIISTYNAANLIRGCLEDLLNQTLYQKGELEIVVIDSGSSENEAEVVLTFQKIHPKIKYLRSEKRDPLYNSWNRGLEIARGKYITNANTDDRHDRKCLEILAKELDDKTDVDLVYGNLYKSLKPNEEFVQNDKSMPCESQQFFPGSLLLHDSIGAQPMWRKSIHDKVGLFDEKYEVVGDYEFVLRAISNGCKFSYVPRAKGLMLWHQNALSTKGSKAHSERLNLLKLYRSPEQIRKIYSPYFKSSTTLQKAYNDLGIRSLCYYPQFNSGNPLFDFSFAQECFSQNTDHISQHNLKTLRKILGSNLMVEGNNNDNLFFYSYSEKLPTEYELKGVEPIYLNKTGVENIQGNVFQKYSFNLSKFYQFFFGQLDIKSLTNTNCVYIWGYNERGNILAKYLESSGLKNVRFIDSNPQIFTKPFQSTEQLPAGFDDIKDTLNVVFILTMSSHHWSSLKSEIEKKLPGSKVLTFDKA